MSDMTTLRDEAKESARAKGRNMGVKIKTADMGEDYGVGKTGPRDDGTISTDQSVYASGYGNPPGKTKGTVGKVVGNIGNEPKKRLDRAAFAAGGRVDGKKAKGTTVNVIVAGAGGVPSTPMAPAMPPAGLSGPAPLPAGGPPPMGGAGMPMMRKRGGRVGAPKMTAGAGSGEGRLQKERAYGKNARKQNPNERE